MKPKFDITGVLALTGMGTLLGVGTFAAGALLGLGSSSVYLGFFAAALFTPLVSQLVKKKKKVKE